MTEIEKVWPSWQVESKIGEGGFGTVYKAKKELFGEVTWSAIKTVSIPNDPAEVKDMSASGLDENSIRGYYQESVKQLVNEIRLMEKMKSASHIVAIEDYEVVEDTESLGWTIFIRMELLKNLNDYIKEYGMDTKAVIQMGEDILTGLEFCHESNLIHRDIKPANIFVSSFGEYKIGDFGISREIERTSSTLSQKGTKTYMAPEIVRMEKYDKRVDIYALGLTMYEICNNGRMPFLPPYPQPYFPLDREKAILRRLNGETFPELPQIGALNQVIQKACAFAPEERYQSAAEMKAALLALGDIQPEVRDEGSGEDSRQAYKPESVIYDTGNTQSEQEQKVSGKNVQNLQSEQESAGNQETGKTDGSVNPEKSAKEEVSRRSQETSESEMDRLKKVVTQVQTEETSEDVDMDDADNKTMEIGSDSLQQLHSILGKLQRGEITEEDVNVKKNAKDKTNTKDKPDSDQIPVNLDHVTESIVSAYIEEQCLPTLGIDPKTNQMTVQRIRDVSNKVLKNVKDNGCYHLKLPYIAVSENGPLTLDCMIRAQQLAEYADKKSEKTNREKASQTRDSYAESERASWDHAARGLGSVLKKHQILSERASGEYETRGREEEYMEPDLSGMEPLQAVCPNCGNTMYLLFRHGYRCKTCKDVILTRRNERTLKTQAIFRETDRTKQENMVPMYTRMLELNPDSAQLYMWLSIEQSEEFDKRRALIKQALTLDDRDASIYDEQAQLEIHDKEYQKAEEHERKAYEQWKKNCHSYSQEPLEPYIYTNLAKALEFQGKSEEAFQWMLKVRATGSGLYKDMVDKIGVGVSYSQKELEKIFKKYRKKFSMKNQMNLNKGNKSVNKQIRDVFGIPEEELMYMYICPMPVSMVEDKNALHGIVLTRDHIYIYSEEEPTGYYFMRYIDLAHNHEIKTKDKYLIITNFLPVDDGPNVDAYIDIDGKAGWLVGADTRWIQNVLTEIQQLYTSKDMGE